MSFEKSSRSANSALLDHHQDLSHIHQYTSEYVFVQGKQDNNSSTTFSWPNFIRSQVFRRWVLIIILALIISDIFFFGFIKQFIKYIKSMPSSHIKQQLKATNPSSHWTHLEKDYLKRAANIYDYFPVVDSPSMSDKPNIAIVTFFSPDNSTQELKKLTFHNFQQYASRHNFTLIDAIDDLHMRQLYHDVRKKYAVPHYFKFMVLAKYLPLYDWIFWADGDSIFLNFNISLASLIDTNYDVIYSINQKKDGFAWSLILNSGHFFLRNSPWTRSFIDEALRMSLHSCKDYLNMIPSNFFTTTSTIGIKNSTAVNSMDEEKKQVLLNGWINLCGEDGGYWLSDQGILQWLIFFKDERYRCHMKFVGFREFNSEFPWYGDGDFILHFPGKTLEERKTLIPLFLNLTDPETGIVNRQGQSSTLMDPVPNPTNAKDMYEKYYAPMNIPCRVWETLLSQKGLLNRRKPSKHDGD